MVVAHKRRWGAVLLSVVFLFALADATFHIADVAITASLNGTTGVAVSPTRGIFFVSDTNNHRVLRYADIFATPEVFGQTATSGNTPNQGSGPTSATLNTPLGIFYDDTTDTLWVADSNNHRVLWYQGASTRIGDGGFNANGVVGQNDFFSQSFGTTSTKLKNPSSVYVYDGRVWIVDQGNNRFLITEYF